MGKKMSKSYGNTIALRDTPDAVEKALNKMPTDTARVRLTDPGEPGRCPVWQFHEVYSNSEVQEAVQVGCREASIGCIQCKSYVVDAVLAEIKPMQERAKEYTEDSSIVRNIIAEGSEKARDVAKETMEEVRQVMGLAFR